MLGLSNGSGMASSNLSIVEGSFRQRVPEGTAGAIQRVNKKGDTINELSFTSLTGWITSITFEDMDWGKMLHIGFKADKDYKLTMGYADGLASNFYKIIPNIDPAYPVSIFLNRKPDEKGVFRTSMFINQKSAPCKWAYTKANPNGMPPFEQITVKGKLTWDNSKQIQFLIDKAVNPFVEKLKDVVRIDDSPTSPTAKPSIVSYPEDYNTNEPVRGVNADGSVSDEDIPF